MRKVQLIIYLLITGFCFSQNKNALELYQAGLKAYDNNDYKKADSLYTLSLKLLPHADTYYNLAITKRMLKDFCGFCDNLSKAANIGDFESLDLYYKNCTSMDTVYYKSNNNIYSYYCVVYNHKCTKTKTYKIYEKRIINNLTSIFDVIVKDSTKFNESNLINPDFDIESIPLEIKVYTACEVMPEYIGGDKARIDFLLANICYPQLAKEKEIQGTVIICFTIDEFGNISDIKILSSVGGGCDEEAIRIIKLMPKWKPGMVGGKPVRVQFYMPIKFTLSG